MIGRREPPPTSGRRAGAGVPRRSGICAWSRGAAPARDRAEQDVDFAARRDAEEPEAEPPAQVSETRIALAPLAASRQPRGEPDFVADARPVDALQHQFEGERQLQLADDDDRGIALAQADEIAAADFPLTE